MITRMIVTASGAALALTALSFPVAHAQSGDADATGGPTGSLGGLGLGGAGSDLLVPESDEVCELPGLGGSVAKFAPLLGVEDVPDGVMDLVTSGLDSAPNVLDMLAGSGGGAALLVRTGSLGGPLCESIFGGEMVLPPITVIVDEDGVPVTTETGAPGAGGGDGSLSGSLTADGEEDVEAVSESEVGGPVARAAGAASRGGTTTVTSRSATSPEGARESGAEALPTTVPVP